MLKLLLPLLLIGVSSGCLNVKLEGFSEIAARNEIGMEHATATPEGAELIRQLGQYINELEYELEKQ